MYGLLATIGLGKFKLSDFTSKFREAAGVGKLASPKKSTRNSRVGDRSVLERSM